MKFSQIRITGTYRRFKDLTLDLTYPEGHAKAGQPLDKVCIIGQSGVGKTTLLELVKSVYHDRLPGLAQTDSTIRLISNHKGKITSHSNLISETELTRLPDFLKKANKYRQFNYQMSEKVHLNKKLIRIGNLLSEYFTSAALIHYPAESIDHVNQLVQQTLQKSADPIIALPEAQMKVEEPAAESYYTKRIIDFSKEDADVLGYLMNKGVSAYRIQDIQFQQRIAEAARDSIQSVASIVEEWKAWQAANPDPVSFLADRMDPLLNKFNLRVSRSNRLTSASALRMIAIEDLHGNNLEYNAWSTGTKQLIINALPLINLKLDEAVVLMDEPERSLYPDIQAQLVEYYTGLAPDAQFFFATHSPVIASAFDPWEIIELKFRPDGTVCQEDYLEPGKSRHVDHYQYYPKYLRWDGILMRIFDLMDEGNGLREAELTRAAYLRSKLEHLRTQGQQHSAEYQAHYEAFLASVKKVGWDGLQALPQ